MSEQFRLQIPDVMGYEVKYYFSETPTEYPPRVFPFHLHDQLELYVLLEGDVSFAVESSLYKLSPGDAIVTRPNEMHNCILNRQSVHKHLCFWFDASSNFLFEAFLSHEFGKNNLICLDEEGKQMLPPLLSSLREASEAGDVHAQYYRTLELLHLYRRFAKGEAKEESLPPLLRQILADIDANFCTLRSMQYFTEKYYVSTSTLGRLFRTHLHTSPQRYLETKRLAYSRLLLREGRTVQDACMSAGFPDYSNYIRTFKRHFGMTPGQYRSTDK